MVKKEEKLGVNINAKPKGYKPKKEEENLILRKKEKLVVKKELVKRNEMVEG